MNQNPEQLARYTINYLLLATGWQVQSKQKINLSTATIVVMQKYQTNIGLASYVLFVDKKPINIIEAKPAEDGVHLMVNGDQSNSYARARQKKFNNESLLFVYKSISELTHFTDYRDSEYISKNKLAM